VGAARRSPFPEPLGVRSTDVPSGVRTCVFQDMSTLTVRDIWLMVGTVYCRKVRARRDLCRW
jgi:hypothetical protein